ncbi:Kinesin motor domain containing protein [Tritrichomonas foetus]|uniref:Kinesin motor domain containing protein n=1 Tax=Tritrichomonas foetus TaxID=1144522 RepID=A0A1J4JTA3_9EUKA|nr:Kinesin motor domain containing protein [Tritrichomonas foetus]|eukprot:OHT02299.1 Kinesin motor domain containing protein [Tritrichomonas foetus]
MTESRTVYVRVKPTNEIAEDFIKLGEDGQSVTVKSLKKPKRSFLKHQISSYSFQFASILQNADQQSMFNLTTKPAIDNALSGVPSCIICNGGPESGKTFTLNGPDNDYPSRGLIPRAIAYIFQRLATQPELGVTVRCSFTEFLNEQLFDILNAFNGQPPKELKIVESKNGRISVKNLFAPVISDEQTGLERLFMGNAYRALNYNIHQQTTSVFTIWFDSDVPQPTTEKPLHTKIHFVDMASPVKFETSNRESEEFHRQASINRTMTVLERVLIATEHIPYRSCPLTHFLKDSLPHRCIIAHVAFDSPSLPATLGTLKFAARVQGETSDDILNLKEHKESQIRRLQKEIDDVRSQLRVRNPQLPFCEPDRQEKQALAETVTSYLSDALQQFPVRSLYEIRAALALMKEQYRAQKVTVEEQLREKYVFTVKPPEVSQTSNISESQRSPLPPEDGIAFFPLVPSNEEMWLMYKNLDGSELDQEINEKKGEVSELKKKKREVALVVNGLKSQIDDLKSNLDEKEKNRLPPIDGVLVIDEEELQIRQSLRDVKLQYKDAYAQFCEIQENEKSILLEIDDKESQLKQNFTAWMEERQKQAVAATEEEEDNEELLDKEERREKREYQKIIDQDPKAGPYFFATKKVQKILEREFRANGTRRQPVTE